MPNFKTLDYVCAWYIKAVKFLSSEASPLDVRKSYAFPADPPLASGGSAAGRRHSLEESGKNDGEAELRRTSSGKAAEVRVAFVSTNSITQGEQVGILWSYLFGKKTKIHFAHRTFKWSNEASGKAGVYCVIIGFGLQDVKIKRLFDYLTPKSEPQEIVCSNINPYLVDAADIIISSRSIPISKVPEIVFGSKPVDGGYLILDELERSELLSAEPACRKFILPMMGAHEFINGSKRYCIWLKDANPTEWRGLAQITRRVRDVREFRLKSKKLPTVKLAEFPYLFAEIRQPVSDYVIIPLHSSESRKYVPIGFLPSSVIYNNSCAGIPNATLFHFAVLTSLMHNAWMRQVCGRLESRYRYSNNLVYNNFPWPENPSEKQIAVIETAAERVLDARSEFPNSSLADLYDPLTMPPALVKAHNDLDRAVDLAYRPQPFTTEAGRMVFLFELYEKYTAGLFVTTKKKKK